jgi:hypothetical protein
MFLVWIQSDQVTAQMKVPPVETLSAPVSKGR